MDGVTSGAKSVHQSSSKGKTRNGMAGKGRGRPRNYSARRNNRYHARGDRDKKEEKEEEEEERSLQVLIIGATNRPQELDSAVLRRLSKKVYVPLPDEEGRRDLLKLLLAKAQGTGKGHSLGKRDVEAIVRKTQRFSGR